MAIQFPPVNPGDPEPQNGDTYLYLATQQEFVCERTNAFSPAKWSAVGTISETSFGYRGLINIQDPAPTDIYTGNMYSVADGGIAHPSFTGLANTQVDQYTLIIFANPDWVPITTETGNVVTSPWVRTVDGQIKPSVGTDDLNMDQGNYLINELPEL